MTNRLVTVCVFCLLCATHSHCTSHGDIHLNISPRSTLSPTDKGNAYDDGGGGSDVGLQIKGLVP